jgi:tetratricopeptide (TPR) repeat protein
VVLAGGAHAATLAQFEPQARMPEATRETGLDRARGLVERGAFDEAEPVLREAVKGDPRSADAAYLLGYVLLRRNKPKESLEEYTRAATLRTPGSDDLKHVSDAYVLLNDFDDADRWMLRAVRMNEKDAEAWYGLGRIRYSEQRFKDALMCFQKTLALAPRSVKAGDNLGLAYEGLNRTPEAIRAFRAAIEWQKSAAHPSEQPLLNLGTVLVEQGQAEEALPMLQQAVGIAPKDAKIREQLGNAYAATGHLAEAQREFEAAVRLSPDTAAYHYLLARVLHREGLEAAAKAEFARSAALNGTHSTPETH